jgi:hypothetical protein
LVIDSDNDVGIGILSPSEKLHVWEANSAARIKLTRNDKSSTATEEADWILNSNGTFRISGGNDAAELTLDASGNLTVTGGYFVNATQLNVPDYVFEPDYQLTSIEEQASYMARNKHLPAVGAAPAKGTAANLNLVQQQLGMLEELEKAHLYIAHLNQELQQLQQRLAQLEQTAN